MRVGLVLHGRLVNNEEKRRISLSIRTSLIYSYLDRYASLAINIVSSMVIARLLTPAEIGIFSVTVVLLSYLASIRDFGAGGYLVQEK